MWDPRPYLPRSHSPLRRTQTRGPGGCDCSLLEDQRLVHDQSSGDTICTTCANVVEEHAMDGGPEWYTDATARAANVGRYDQFLGGSNGAVVPDNKKRYAEPDTTKNMRAGFLEIERCGSLLGMDGEHQMCLAAKRFFTDYATARKAQGRGIRETERTAAAACSLYFGCKSHERAGDRFPRTIKEISGQCGVALQDCTELAKSFKSLLADKPYSKLLFTTVTAEDLLMRAAGGIAFETTAERNTVLKKARSIFEAVKAGDYLEGRTPETVCSAVLYRAFELTGVNTKKMTKKMVYTACAVSNVSLNKGLDDLKKCGL